MELWKELLISGLQNDSIKRDNINDNILKEIITDRCYRVLLKIKRILDDDKLSDKDCFIKIEEIICELEKENIFVDRHDFG